MSASISEIIQTAADLVIEVRGDMARKITCVRPLSEPVAGCLTFAKNDLPVERLRQADLVGCVILCAAVGASAPTDRTYLITSNPRLAFLRAVTAHFLPPKPLPGAHPTAVVDPSAKVDPAASIGAYTLVGANCEIGPGVILYPHVTLYSGVKIGAKSIVNSGTVIGADGFGYERNSDGVLEKFPHVGGVIIGIEVEIGSNTSIDRGTLGDTVIGDRVRIDNQCHISHNVRIGADSAVIAQSMLGGSVSLGIQTWVAPAAIVMNQVKVGAKATIGMAAVVVKDVPENSTVTGSPAVDIEEFRSTRKIIKSLFNGNKINFKIQKEMK